MIKISVFKFNYLCNFYQIFSQEKKANKNMNSQKSIGYQIIANLLYFYTNFCSNFQRINYKESL